MHNRMLDKISNLIDSSTFPFSILAIAVFGSTAGGRATESSDVDLLIIADGLSEKFHRRTAEIVSIKRALPGLPVDVLLLTPEEALSNFDNHNPLFLDIAEEGVILKDTGGLLGGLTQKTRAYIRSRGIRKLRDAWRFPVRAGAATKL